jgi:hypothetical protein
MGLDTKTYWLTDRPTVSHDVTLTWTGFSFEFLSDSDKVESPGGFSSWECKDKNGACDLKTLIMCNIWSAWLSETVLVCVEIRCKETSEDGES